MNLTKENCFYHKNKNNTRYTDEFKNFIIENKNNIDFYQDEIKRIKKLIDKEFSDSKIDNVRWSAHNSHYYIKLLGYKKLLNKEVAKRKKIKKFIHDFT